MPLPKTVNPVLAEKRLLNEELPERDPQLPSLQRQYRDMGIYGTATGPMGGGKFSVRTALNKAVILDSFKQGHTPAWAAARAGLIEKTLRNWMAEDRDFNDECTIAKALGEIVLFENAQKKAEEKRDWNFERWVLENRNSEDWGKKQVQVQHGLDGASMDMLASISAEQLAAARKLLALPNYDDIIEGEYEDAGSDSAGLG